MARTPVAELDAEVVERLEEYVGEFVADFGLITRRYWAGVYLQGLLLDGERKSIGVNCLCFLAYGFLALERERGTPTALDADAEEPSSPFQA